MAASGTVRTQDWWTCHKTLRCVGRGHRTPARSAWASSRNRRKPEMRVPTSQEERAAEAMALRRYSTVTATKDGRPVSSRSGKPCTSRTWVDRSNFCTLAV